MRVGDEALVRALGSADGAPDLCESNRREVRVTTGALRWPDGPCPQLQSNEPLPPGLRPLGVRRPCQVGKEETVGSCTPPSQHPLL